MTWSARVTMPDGTVPEGTWSACQACKHGQYDFVTPKKELTQIVPCFVPKVAQNIGSLLTAVDVGADGHMASGNAELRCNGFEQKPVPEKTEPDAKPYPIDHPV